MKEYYDYEVQIDVKHCIIWVHRARI